MSVNAGSDRVYKSIFESSLDTILLTTPDGTILAANLKAEEILGYSQEELLQLNMSRIVDTCDPKLTFILEKSRIEGKSDHEIIIIRKNGEKCNALIFSHNFRDEDGNELFSVVIKEIKEINKLELALEDSEKQFHKLFENITKRKDAEEELIESKNRLFDIIDFLPDPTFAINSKGEIIAWNRAIEAITGFKAEDILGKGNYEYALPLYGMRRPILIDLVTDPNKIIEKQYSTIKRWEDGIFGETNAPLKGINRILWGKAVPLYDDKGLINGAIEVIRDITENKKAEKEVIESLHEKELLIKEIHHRVKNNMQIVSSLLNLQTNYVDEEETVDVLKESQNRVRSMAMIHEELYQSGDLTHINFVNYVQNLIQKLLYAYNIDATLIKPILEIENINLNMETAVPCGLIISELVSNSLKYAFPNGMTGEIYISLKSKDEKFELIICDNGIGLPENFDFNQLDSLGLLLVKNLTDQIDGDLTINGTTGTEFIIIFEELEYKTRI